MGTKTLKLIDISVMHVFLRFDEFMERIIKGMESSVLEIAAVSLKIVTLIWRNGSLYHKPKVQRTILGLKKSNLRERISQLEKCLIF